MTSNKKRTLLVLLGIVLGVTAYIIFTGIMFGFQEYIVEQLVNNNFQILISSREEFLSAKELDKYFFGTNVVVRWLKPPSGRRDSNRIENPPFWYNFLAKNNKVVAFSQQLQINAFATKGNASQNITLIGCYPKQQMKVTNIRNYMVKGKFADIASGSNRIIVGSKLLKRLGAQVSENIFITSPNGEKSPFKIVGEFELGVKRIDEATAYALIEDVQKVNQTPGYISDIAIKLRNVGQSKKLATLWNKFNTDRVLSWEQAHENILSVFRIQDFIRNFMSIAIMLVAGFGIYNVLNILISQKRFEIAILRSMGYESMDVIKLFMLQGVILGLLGGIIGLVLGYLGCRYLGMLPVVGGRYGKGGHMLISYNIIIYINAFLLAVVVSFISSVIPAWHAGKVSPIEILRSEIRE